MSPNPPLTESPEPSPPVVVTERKREGLVFRVVSERGRGKRRRERESSRKEKKVFFPFLARVPNSPPPIVLRYYFMTRCCDARGRPSVFPCEKVQ